MTPHYVYWRFLFWPQLAGIIFLVLGLIVVRRRLSLKLDSMTVLGRLLVPFALAVFGGEHLASASFIKDMVPSWVPGHLFFAYLVGFALFAAAISILADRCVGTSATLLGLMIFSFVLTLHIPRVIAAPADRFGWAVAARDFFFALGAWTLAATHFESTHPSPSRLVIKICRYLAALVFLFFGVEHLLHPDFCPGVPLQLATPAWVPLKSIWGYCVGALLLASSLTILVNRKARTSTTLLAIGCTLVVLFINFPLLLLARQPSDINTGVNYVADTLLFAGMVFFLASAMPADETSKA